MRKTLILSLLFFSHGLLIAEPPQISLSYPQEGATMPFLKKSFVLGSVSPATATVTINGSTIAVYKTGSFASVIPFESGNFSITALAEADGLYTEAVRNIIISSPSVSISTDSLVIIEDSMFPAKDIQLPAGKNVTVGFHGTPGAQAQFRLSKARGDGEWRTMVDVSSTFGKYRGFTRLKSSEREYTVEFRLKKKSFRTAKESAPGKLLAINSLEWVPVEVSTEQIILKPGPSINGSSMGYDLFIPKGVRLRAQGYKGEEVRLKLSDQEIHWGEEKYLKVLPETTNIPTRVLGNLKTKNKDRSVLLFLNLDAPVPYRMIPSEDLKSFTLRLYYTVSNTDRIRLDTLGKKTRWVENIRWVQPQRETVEVIARLKEKIWGYDLRYVGNQLIAEIFFAPRTKKFGRPLKNITVAVDPGHSPIKGDGAISPKGYTEGEINYQISECLKQKLEAMGAKVFITREKDKYMSLPERAQKAIKAGSEIFVSVHANAVPATSDPLSRRGYSVFYFHPMSLDLAKSVHTQYPKLTQMEDDGLFYGNLAVCRNPRIPSILFEAGYLIRPDEEELLSDPVFQCKAALGIAKGVADFVRSYR